jgi:alpha-L-rhamnosidase
MGIVQSNIQSFILGLTGFFLAFFNVMLIVIRPMWEEINKFINQALGLQFQWVRTVFVLALVLSAFYSALFFTHLNAEETNGYIAVAAFFMMIIFSIMLISLYSQVRRSLFSFITASKFYRILVVFFTGSFSVLLAGIAFAAITSDAVFYNRTSAAILSLMLIVPVGCSIFKATSAGREETSRWPAAEKSSNPGWDAQWIVPDTKADVSKANTWICFRKAFDMENIPGQLYADIAADSKYWLWINGVPAVAEGGLKRGPNPYDTYYDTIDIGPFLKKGRNLIAVLVWHFGKNAFSHKDSGQAGLIFNSVCPEISLVSDSSWLAAIHPAYQTAGSPEPNFRLSESSILFDANRDIPGWTSDDIDSEFFKPVRLKGRPPISPWNNLMPRPIPMWKDYGLKDYSNAQTFPFISDGKGIECQLPYNAQVQPYFEIEAQAGFSMDIRTDDYQGGGEYGIRTCYITKEGTQSFECPAWMNGHKVIYSFPEGIRVLSLKFRETGYDSDFAGNFECSDPFFNRLWQKASRTLYVTMRDNYMDCPDRERAQWWGDAVIEIGESFYTLSPSSHLLAKKAIHELCGWQKKNDSLYSPVPSGNWNIELSQQSLAGIGWYGIWNYYMNTGDVQTIKAAYPKVKRYIDLWQVNSQGQVSHRRTGWNWGDWGENVDVSLLETEWYYLALKGLRSMADVADMTGDVGGYEEKMRLIKDNFRKNYWSLRDNAYRSPGYKDKTDDRANALVVVAGLADIKDYPYIRRALSTEFHASPYMEKYVLEALFLMGFGDDALARMKKRYVEMVQSPCTTLWEGWEIGSLEYGGGTYNHAWSGGPLTLLSMYAAGIRSVKPGYEEFEVMPQMGGLTSVRCTVPSVKGPIELDMKKDKKMFRLNIIAPAGTKGAIVLPAEFSGDIKIIDGSGEAHEGLQTTRNGRLEFIITPGEWSLSAAEK